MNTLRALKTKRGLIFMCLATLSGLQGLSYAAESDIFWEARTGGEILKHGFTLTDTYSDTIYGTQWLPNSWGWNMVLYVFSHLGVPGFMLLTFLAVALQSALLGHIVRLVSQSWTLTYAAMTLYVLCIVPFSTARPQAADYIITMLIILAAYFNAKYTRYRKHMFVIFPLLTLLWENMHLSGIVSVSVVFFASWAFLWLYNEKWVSSLKSAIVYTLPCLPMLLLTPYGIQAIEKMFVTSSSSQTIFEWLSPNEAYQSGAIGEFSVSMTACLVLVVTIAFLLVRGLSPFLLAVIFYIVVYFQGGVRFAPFLTIWLAVYLAVLWAAARSQSWAARVAFPARVRTSFLIFATIANLAGTGYFLSQMTFFSDVQKVAAAVPHRDQCRVVAPYIYDNFMIWSRPDCLVNADGRNDIFPSEWAYYVHLAAYKSLTEEYALKHDINVVVTYEGTIAQKYCVDHGWKKASEAATSDRSYLVYEKPIS